MRVSLECFWYNSDREIFYLIPEYLHISNHAFTIDYLNHLFKSSLDHYVNHVGQCMEKYHANFFSIVQSFRLRLWVTVILALQCFSVKNLSDNHLSADITQ